MLQPPDREDDRPGFEIQGIGGIDRGSFFHAMGLRDGDVVHTVNGAAVASLAQAVNLLEVLGDAGQVTLGIERDGASLVLHYVIR